MWLIGYGGNAPSIATLGRPTPQLTRWGVARVSTELSVAKSDIGYSSIRQFGNGTALQQLARFGMYAKVVKVFHKEVR